MPELFELFDEYAAAYARGERPQAREYLARAGPQADELAGLIDEFLQRSPAAEPAPAYLRATSAIDPTAPPPSSAAAERERDEIDELFLFSADK